MKNNFVIGNEYYIKITQENSEMATASTEQFALIFTSGKYRISGGTWVSANNILLSKIPNNYIKISISGSPVGSIETDSYFEIVGTLGNIISFNYSLSVCKAVQQYTIPNPIEIELDNLNCEPHLVSKTSGTNLLYVDTAYGVFREEQNVLTPSVVIEYDSVPNFNYVYIPSLSRYYFVTGITLVRYRVYRVDLKVDVLCTYDSDIRLQDAFVSRCRTTYASTPYLIDERIPLDKIPSKVTSKLSYDVASGLQFNPKRNTNDYTIVVSVITNNASATTQTGSKSNLWDSNLPEVSNFMGNSPSIYSYAITYDDWVTLCQKLLDDDTLETYVVNAIMYPFIVSSDAFVSAGLKQIYLGSENSGVSGYVMQGTFSHYRFYFDCTFSKRFTQGYNNFLNYEPYRKLEIYLPYHGWTTLDSRRVVGNTIYIYYEHDYVNGDSQILIYDHTNNVLLDTYRVNIGIKLPISSTNARENQNLKDSSFMNMIMGMYGSAIQMGVGAGSGKYGSAIGGGFSGAKAYMNRINDNMFIYDKANTLVGTEILGNISPMDAYIRETYFAPVSGFDATKFAELNGYKWDEYVNISSANCSGYTEIPDMHYVPSSYKFITKTEIDEIISLAKNGIIL